MLARNLILATLLASPAVFAQQGPATGTPGSAATTPPAIHQHQHGQHQHDAKGGQHQHGAAAGQHQHGAKGGQRQHGAGSGGRGMMGADANKDGAVSRDEAQAMLNQRFDRLDANKDGKLTEDEMRAAHAAARKEHAGRFQAAMEQRFKGADANGDGKLSREEAGTMPGLARNFDRLDANKDGNVTQDELRSVSHQRSGRHENRPQVRS